MIDFSLGVDDSTFNIYTPQPTLEYEAKKFSIGQRYELADWSTDRVMLLEVVARTLSTVTLIEYVDDQEYKRIKPIQNTEMGDEYVVIFDYGAYEAKVFAY